MPNRPNCILKWSDADVSVTSTSDKGGYINMILFFQVPRVLRSYSLNFLKLHAF